MKTALFLPNWVGDAVMATPAIRLLKEHRPDTQLIGVGLPHIIDTLASNPHLDRMIIRNPKSKKSIEHGWGLYHHLQQEHFDEALLFTNSFRSAWQAWLTGARKIIGFNRDYRAIFLSKALPCPDKKIPHPVLNDYLKLATVSLNIDHTESPPLVRTMELFLTTQDESRYQQFRSSIAQKIGTHEKYICLNPGGAFGAAKHWPTSYFGRLAQKIIYELGYGVVVLCGPAERQIAGEIVSYAQHPKIISLQSDQISIGLSKAIVKHASLMVTTDSGPRHFAAPFNVPVITLFGPTHIPWSETYYKQAIHLQEKLPCGPCQQRVCPLKHHQCMTNLTVEKVFLQVLKLHQQQLQHAA